MSCRKSVQPRVFAVMPPLTCGIVEIQLLRSRRRTLAVEITRNCELLVRAPFRCPQNEIVRFLRSNDAWITVHFEQAQARADAHPEPDDVTKSMLITKARSILPELTARYAVLMGVKPKQVRITGAKKRFGSCSSENNICYSWRLMTYPDRAVEYVVVHELAHIRYKNHGTAFYAYIESILPDWRERAELLKK